MRRVKGNEEFVKWWDRWTRRIQRNRAWTQPSQTAKDGQIEKQTYRPSSLGGDFKPPHIQTL